MNDPVADLLTRIRNALKADQQEVLIPSSRINREIARLLKQEGYIEDFAVERMHRQAGSRPSRAEFETIRVTLKYTQDRDSVISGLQRLSKPGRRLYCSYKDLRPVLAGMGISVVSTSRGVMSDRKARAERLGGELLCYVW